MASRGKMIWSRRKGVVSLPYLRVDFQDRGYPIHIGSGLLGRTGSLLKDIFPPSTRILVVGDPNTIPLFGRRVGQSLQEAGFTAAFFAVPAGEEAKELQQVTRVAQAAIDFGLGRDDLLVALGGGAVGDLTGFCAASYMRGVALAQVPTTLLAQVDSSVGGKVAVNHPGGKNMLGFFYQPRLVLMDPDVLDYLPEREFRSGVMEIIKYGVLADKELFAALEKNMAPGGGLPKAGLPDIIYKACSIKRDVVLADETEEGPRMVLNLGHTLGHALERETAYHYFRHGEAVGIGIIWACRLAVKLGMLDPRDSGRVETLIKKAGFPPIPKPVQPEAVLKAMNLDKKKRQGEQVLVLPREVGKVEIIRGVPAALLQETVVELLAELTGTVPFVP
jgi:3-dehydroquinate synthase